MKWQRTPKGRLKAPTFPKLSDEEFWAINPFEETVHKTPLSKINEFVYIRESGISAGTVGKIVEIQSMPNYGNHVKVQTLDGKIRLEKQPHCIVIPYSMVQEVKDFYIIEEKRPDRIKVDW